MSASRKFVCCPHCKEVVDLERVGSVGVSGVRDSRSIRCNGCGKTFYTEGETFKEAHGGLR